MMVNTFMEKLQIKYPIIQAPMAGGITTSDLVQASAKAGALGMFGAGYLSAQALRKEIRNVDQTYRDKIGVNIFVPQVYDIEKENVARMKTLLETYYDKYDIDPNEINLGSMENDSSIYDSQIDVCIAEKVGVVSFTFGLPDASDVARLQDAGIYVMGTATSLDEFAALEKHGVDAVVIQNKNAGGHQGSFLKSDSKVGFEKTLKLIKEKHLLPFIVSGGLMTKEDVEEMLSLGASGVQMGTAFLLTEESGAHPLHKESILNMSDDRTTMTRAFSGRDARGVKNAFIDDIEIYKEDLIAYPLLNRLTQPIRKAAKANGDVEFLSLWSGVNGYKGKAQTVEELMASLVGEEV